MSIHCHHVRPKASSAFSTTSKFLNNEFFIICTNYSLLHKLPGLGKIRTLSNKAYHTVLSENLWGNKRQRSIEQALENFLELGHLQLVGSSATMLVSLVPGADHIRGRRLVDRAAFVTRFVPNYGKKKFAVVHQGSDWNLQCYATRAYEVTCNKRLVP